jgi:IS30 family transposase
MKQLILHYLLVERWSPEFISKTIQFEQTAMVSHERIYQWIWECKHSNAREHLPYKQLYQYLKHGKRRRKRGARKDNRGVILNRTPLAERPAIVAQRTRLGDIEVDLMMGKNHKGALLVMTDRATLHTRLKKVASKHSKHVGEAIIDCLQQNEYPTQTLTFDNDKAFACHTEVKNETGANTYFTRPYTSQDKGTVENRIGVLRRFFPKKTDLTLITDELIKDVERKLNNRPVRKFKYLTPNQVLQQKIALIT